MKLAGKTDVAASGRKIRMITVPGSCLAVLSGHWCVMAWAVPEAAVRLTGGLQCHRTGVSGAVRPVRSRAGGSFFEKGPHQRQPLCVQQSRPRGIAGRHGHHGSLCLVRGGEATLCHAGDSRAYLCRGGKLTQLTHDHSYVQELVDCGTITEEEAEHHPQKNIITKALGVDYRLEPESLRCSCRQRICCCSARTA